MTDLLPCPFCGEKRIFLNKPNPHHKRGSINCPACLVVMPGEVNETELIDCWNTRSTNPVPAPPEDYPLYSASIAWSDEDDAYVGMIPELPGCTADGETPEACIAELRNAKAAWIDACLQVGNLVPAPRPWGSTPWPNADDKGNC